jgi:hypothetical protein
MRSFSDLVASALNGTFIVAAVVKSASVARSGLVIEPKQVVTVRTVLQSMMGVAPDIPELE